MGKRKEADKEVEMDIVLVVGAIEETAETGGLIGM